MSRVFLRGGRLIRRKPDHYDGPDITLAASRIVEDGMAWKERASVPAKMAKARQDKTYWRLLERIARDKYGWDLEEEMAKKHLHLTFMSDEERVASAALGTMMNARGNDIGKFDHIAPQNYKVELTDNRVPDTVAGILLEDLRKAVMGPQKLLEGDIEDAEFIEEEGDDGDTGCSAGALDASGEAQPGHGEVSGAAE